MLYEVITVKLYDTNGNLLAETVTDAQGIYWFTGLDAGEYEVEFVITSYSIHYTKLYERFSKR